MSNPKLVDEIISLDALRVQKVFGLFNSILVMEFYSPIFKRLYFVVDQNPKTSTLHVQKHRPKGFKTKSMLINLLNKYAINQTLRFYKLDKEGEVLKAIFIKDGEDFSLIFESFPKISVGFFRNEEFLASLKKGVAPHFRRSHLLFDNITHELLENQKRAEIHEKMLLDYHRTALFERHLAELNRQVVKKQNLLNNVLLDLKKCEANLARSHDAELLKQNFHLLKRGMKIIELIDYQDGEPRARKISLDPSLSPQDFLLRTFNKIKRAKRGIAMIAPRLQEIAKELSLLKKRVDAIKAKGPHALSLDDVASDLETTIKEKKKDEKRLPFKTFISSDNIKILVGKSAKDSDDLTLHHTRGNEWWLHTHDIAGAHVVIKTTLDHIPSSTLVEASMLAMHFSKAHQDAHANVQYTRAKHIRKPKGLAAGKVLVANAKSIAINRDEVALKKILAREQKL